MRVILKTKINGGYQVCFFLSFSLFFFLPISVSVSFFLSFFPSLCLLVHWFVCVFVSCLFFTLTIFTIIYYYNCDCNYYKLFTSYYRLL